jgi:hypothetical protein
MRHSIFMIAGIAAVLTIAVIACTNSSANSKEPVAKMDATAMVKRGAYLVNSMGCDDCHSPKRMGPNGPELIPELRLSGYPQNAKMPPVDSNQVKKGWTMIAPGFTSFVGDWGASFAGNLTSDGTGIGNWSEENFIRAIREGKLKGLANGRPILPPMPWWVYRNLTDEDLKSIFAYLKTTNPVKNLVPAPKPFAALQ